jgi:hypothetical protein
MSSLSCDTSQNVTTWTDLRIAPIFSIWVTGTLGAAFPILAYRSSVTRVPRTLFEYVFSAWYQVHHSQIAQVRQISRFWCHHRHSIYPPPSPRH